MNHAPNEQETRIRSEVSHTNKTAWRFFWIAIFVLAGVTILLILAGALRDSEPAAPQTYEIPQTRLETILSETAKTAQEIVAPDIAQELENVYSPVYAAIPEYADFHYSVLGQYSELTAFALGQMGDDLYQRLFNGFEQRFSDAGTALDQQYEKVYRDALDEQIENTRSIEQSSLPLGELTQKVLDDAVSRARITAPLAGTAAVITGNGALKVTAATIAKTMAAKVAAKTAVKGAVKGGSVLAGAGGAAVLCSWSGPGAVLCGLIGGTVAWFSADGVIINIDEYFNRDEFEADLRASIDEDRIAKQSLIEEALRNKATQMDEDFTLSEFYSDN